MGNFPYAETKMLAASIKHSHTHENNGRGIERKTGVTMNCDP